MIGLCEEGMHECILWVFQAQSIGQMESVLRLELVMREGCQQRNSCQEKWWSVPRFGGNGKFRPRAKLRTHDGRREHCGWHVGANLLCGSIPCQNPAGDVAVTSISSGHVWQTQQSPTGASAPISPEGRVAMGGNHGHGLGAGERLGTTPWTPY